MLSRAIMAIGAICSAAGLGFASFNIGYRIAGSGNFADSKNVETGLLLSIAVAVWGIFALQLGRARTFDCERMNTHGRPFPNDELRFLQRPLPGKDVPHGRQQHRAGAGVHGKRPCVPGAPLHPGVGGMRTVRQAD